MIGGLGMSAMGLAAAGALAAAVPNGGQAPAEASIEARGDALGAVIERRMAARGSFFTAEERAVIERACGYAPGEWDGRQATIHDDTLICTNGRRADGPEVRAVLRAVEPRIEAFVEGVMASPEVTRAMARLTDEATTEALRSAEVALAALEDFDIDVDVDPGDGVDVDVDVDVNADPDADVDDDPDDDGVWLQTTLM